MIVNYRYFPVSQVFGAFLSTDIIERRKHESEGFTYFGTGECFVFTVRYITLAHMLIILSAGVLLKSAEK